MAATTMLDLPTELLQKIFLYLDWNRGESLTPKCLDIIQISLTCRHLRQAVLPILFRNVTLKLRWVDGALVEPALLRIRQKCPELAKHVRCVFVQTLFVQLHGSEWRSRPFTVPEGLQDWMDPSASALRDDDVRAHLSHRQRVNKVARDIFDSPHYPESLSKCPSELRAHADSLAAQLYKQFGFMQQRHPGTGGSSIDGKSRRSRLGEDTQDTYFDTALEEATLIAVPKANIESRTQSRRLRRQLDALFLVMLCLPPTLNSLVFECLPTDRMDTLQNAFALDFAATAINIFGDRLQQLTMITCPLERRPIPGRPNITRRSVESDGQNDILTPEIIGELGNVKKLALASHNRGAGGMEQAQDLGRWHTTSSTVTDLSLSHVVGEPREFVKLIKEFTNLQTLSLKRIHLQQLFYRHLARQSQTTCWLSFLIELRREVPAAIFAIQNVEIGAAEELSSSGVRWLLEEAVPPGRKLDFERETRLMEDFESFFPLWEAEDSVRGEGAREARKDGKLVDAAMSSRWRGLKF